MTSIAPEPVATCPECAEGMKLERVIPGLGVFPELLVFLCPRCGDEASRLTRVDHAPRQSASSQVA